MFLEVLSSRAPNILFPLSMFEGMGEQSRFNCLRVSVPPPPFPLVTLCLFSVVKSLGGKKKIPHKLEILQQ